MESFLEERGGGEVMGGRPAWLHPHPSRVNLFFLGVKRKENGLKTQLALKASLLLRSRIMTSLQIVQNHLTKDFGAC